MEQKIRELAEKWDCRIREYEVNQKNTISQYGFGKYNGQYHATRICREELLKILNSEK